MNTLPLCLFLRLRLYFVKIVDLVDLTYPVVDHVRCISLSRWLSVK